MHVKISTFIGRRWVCDRELILVSVRGWLVQTGGTECVIDVSSFPFFTSNYWLVPNLCVGFLVQRHAIGVYHVGLARCFFAPYIETYIVHPADFYEDGDLTCIDVFRPVMDFCDLVGRWLEDGVARFGLVPTSS